ncbi:translocon-associated protein subunit alpha [Tetranychus urticae]|uniref:Translocon-associated protein subunit alpha n=1 Tax=Tetranychus urticae TaxID=32264 RepID=T1KTQ2_TETUR|nr:translocon-associated protein subunit alpha [Tetranychus urticae]
MMLLNRISLILLLLIPLNLFSPTISFQGVDAADQKNEPNAGSDSVEGEDEAAVEEDAGGDALVSGTGEDEDDSLSLKPSPDVDTYFMFTKPAGKGLELPANSDAHFLVGFANRGQKDFIVESMGASFRYAMDFNFHIQNFSAIPYNKVIKPNEETTLAYSFFISEAYSTRPYGFTVELHYKDKDGNQFMNAVFNETVSIVEVDEGLDGETIFLYIFLIALVGLLAFGAQQLFFSMSKKRISAPKAKVEVGTVSTTDVDYDWLPPETLSAINKSPRNKASPRQRKVKRGTGSSEDE